MNQSQYRIRRKNLKTKLTCNTIIIEKVLKGLFGFFV